MRRRVVFLDRDGVINRDLPEAVTRPEDFAFLPRSLDALRRLAQGGFACVVVTNQSAVGRGRLAAETLAEIHRRMVAGIRAAGGDLLDILACPHPPDAGCACRKPAAGMLLEAARRHGIDLSAAGLVGDRAGDILSARRAGLAYALLVRTGQGETALAELSALGVQPDAVVADLAAAAEWILARAGREEVQESVSVEGGSGTLRKATPSSTNNRSSCGVLTPRMFRGSETP